MYTGAGAALRDHLRRLDRSAAVLSFLTAVRRVPLPDAGLPALGLKRVAELRFGIVGSVLADALPSKCAG